MPVSFMFHCMPIFQNFYKTSAYLLSTVFSYFFKKQGHYSSKTCRDREKLKPVLDFAPKNYLKTAVRPNSTKTCAPSLRI